MLCLKSDTRSLYSALNRCALNSVMVNTYQIDLCRASIFIIFYFLLIITYKTLSGFFLCTVIFNIELKDINIDQYYPSIYPFSLTALSTLGSRK